MIRAGAAFACCLAIVLPSRAPAADVPMILPLPARLGLCQTGAPACIEEPMPTGADARPFLTRHLRPGKTYHLRILVPAGTWSLPSSWRIDGRDLPREITRLSIAGTEPGSRLTGAPTLSALGARATRSASGELTVELPPALRAELASARRYSADDAAWPALLDTQGRLHLTRWPRDGWASFTQSMSEAATASLDPGEGAPVAAWQNEPDAWIWGFFRYPWHAEYRRLAPVDTERRRLRPLGPITYGMGTSGRFRIVNLKSALQKPGEYWIDFARGRIHALPRASSPASELRLTTLASPLIELRNVRGAEVSDLTLSHTRGHGMVIADSGNVELSRLFLQEIGRAGIVVEGGREVVIHGCTLADLGDQAVILRGGDRTRLLASGHRIEGCTIRRPSQRLNTPATAIRLEGVGQQVRANVILQTPHSAVYFDGNDHLIEGNWIEKACLEVDDAGAIYAGRDWTFRGNTIARNVIAGLPRRDGRANLNGVYLDDMLSGTRVSGNLFFDLPRGVLVGGGRDNVVSDNLFVDVATSILLDQRALEWASDSARPGGVMRNRLAMVPYRDARWTRAYPALATMPVAAAAVPEHNELRGNLMIASGAPQVSPRAAASGIIEPGVDVSRLAAPEADVRRFLTSCKALDQCAKILNAMTLPEAVAP